MRSPISGGRAYGICFMVQAPRAEELPARERHQVPGWVIVVRSDVGLVRRRLEDAWRVLPQTSMAGRNVLALGVFDGLGGVPNGQDAAWAAAEHLPEALARAHEPDQVLGQLNPWVRETQGATTAVVAVFPLAGDGGVGTLLSAGDSGAYMLDAQQRAALLVPKDAEGPSVVTEYLGHPEPHAHATPCRVPRGAAILLCTDGVDGVVDPETLARALRTPDLAAGVDDLFADVLSGGAPDNATVVLARRT